MEREQLNKYIVLLDAGHGGVDKNGEPVTAGKRFRHPGRPIIIEGLYNRAIQTKVASFLGLFGVKTILIPNQQADMPLWQRTKLINSITNNADNLGYKTLLVSLHFNAGGGTGYEIFTHKGHSVSDLCASVFYEVYAEKFPNLKARKDMSDGDPDKEENFSLLRNTVCPALLVEHCFMDNPRDAAIMQDPKGLKAFAGADAEAIFTILERGIL